MRFTFRGKIERIDIAKSSLVFLLPVSDPAFLPHFGEMMFGSIDLSPGDDLPYRLAQFSMLKEAWISSRSIETILAATGVVLLNAPSYPPGTWVGLPDCWIESTNVASAFPYYMNQYAPLVWVCESLRV